MANTATSWRPEDSRENKNIFTPYLIEKYLLVFCLDSADFGVGKDFQKHPLVRNVGKFKYEPLQSQRSLTIFSQDLLILYI